MGMTTALEAARAGLAVCVVERGIAGREASWAGGGILSPLPPDQPVPEIRALLDESLRLFPAYCAALQTATGIDPEYWVCGADVRGHGGRRWFPDIAQLRNPRFMQALRAALGQARIPLLEQTPVLGWATRGSRLTGVRTGQGVIACRQAVLAAGAWSATLADVPVEPAKGQMLLLRGWPGMLDHILMDDEAYLVPRRDGRVLVGSTVENAGFDVTPTAQARVFLMEHARSLWPDAAGLPIENHWAGLRPRPAGAEPLIGPLAGIDGLYLNTGHFRLGITLSLASAKKVVRALGR